MSVLAEIQPVTSEHQCLLVQNYSQLNLSRFKKHQLRSRLDSTSSLRTPLFLSTELISAQSEQFNKMIMSVPAGIQHVALEHPCSAQN